MITRSMLTDSIVNTLLEREFEVLVTRGCFDIAAKRERIMLIKSLTNVDGFDHDQAKSLRTISYFVSASPYVISVRTNRNFLTDNTIYQRFDLPVVTPKTFENMLEEDAYMTNSAKGRHTVTIDASSLRDRRYEMKFTLEELASIVGVSKKAIYEIESKRVNPTEKTTRKLETALKVKLRSVFSQSDHSPKGMEPEHIIAKDQLQRTVNKELDRIGIRNSPVSHAPFEIVGREDNVDGGRKGPVITGISEHIEKIERVANPVSRLSKIFGSMAFLVARQKKERVVDGLPVLLEEELEELGSAKELERRIEEDKE